MFDWFGPSKTKRGSECVIIEWPTQECASCNKEMRMERVIYEGMCWECFKKEVIAITKNTESIEDSALILHLLDLARIHYKGPEGRF